MELRRGKANRFGKPTHCNVFVWMASNMFLNSVQFHGEGYVCNVMLSLTEEKPGHSEEFEAPADGAECLLAT